MWWAEAAVRTHRRSLRVNDAGRRRVEHQNSATSLAAAKLYQNASPASVLGKLNVATASLHIETILAVGRLRSGVSHLARRRAAPHATSRRKCLLLLEGCIESRSIFITRPRSAALLSVNSASSTAESVWVDMPVRGASLTPKEIAVELLMPSGAIRHRRTAN